MIRRDLVAGVTVAVVLVPQSIAYADVAGMPPASGLYAAALPPIAAALFASSPYLQTGPVAVTSLLAFATLSSQATPASDEYVGLGIMLALLVGLIRIAVGVFRLGVIAHLMSEPMLRGFLPAAAILIAASQVPAALGVSSNDSILEAAFDAISSPATWGAAAIAFSIATLVIVTRGLRARPSMPAVLIAVVGSIVISSVSGYAGETVGEISAGLPEFPALSLGSIASLVGPAGVIALVGFTEAASVAKTFAAQDRRTWDADREFIGQGVANVAAAVSGAFPVGASLSRSALNRQAGAVSRASGAVTGATVLILLPFVALLEPLPDAVLATIVIVAVSGLVLKLGQTAALWRISRPQAVIAWTTFVLTLVLSPRVDLAVTIGIAMAIIWHLIRELRVDLDASVEGRKLRIQPHGVLWFGTAESLQERVVALLELHPEATEVCLDLSGLGRIDVSGMLALRSLCDNLRSGDVVVEIRGLPAQAEGLAARIGIDPGSTSVR